MNYLPQSKIKEFTICLSTGLALFAMYFGAGNLIYPLQIGAAAGNNDFYAIIGFLLTGVGIPWLGLYSMMLYQGNIEEIFQPLGKWVTQILMIIIALIIGVLFANPRTATVTSSTIAPFLPKIKYLPILLHFIFFSVVFAVAVNKNRMVDILGYIFSPLKLSLLILLIFVSLLTAKQIYPVQVSVSQVFSNAFFSGYNTMDLFASIFFCGIALGHLKRKLDFTHNPEQHIKRMRAFSCLVGAVVISIIYTGFILAANHHSAILQHSSTAGLITVLSSAVLGNLAAIFIASCVTFACLATSIALTVSVTTMFFDIINKYVKVTYPQLVLLVVIVNFMISNLGFNKIMLIAAPILTVSYPFFIVILMMNLLAKYFSFKRRLSYILVLSTLLYFVL